MSFPVPIPCSKPKHEGEYGGTSSIMICAYPVQLCYDSRRADLRPLDLYPTVWAINR